MIFFRFLYKEANSVHSIPISLNQAHESYRSLSGEAKKLIITNIVLAIGLGLGSTFLNIFLWRQIHNFSIISIFYLVQYPIIFGSFLIFGTIPFRFKLRTLLQIGSIFYIGMFVLLIIFQGNIADYLWIVGIIYGAGIGISACGSTAFQYTLTRDENRDKFYSIGIAQGLLLSIILPFLSGIIISQNFIPFSIIGNYYILFFLAICLLVVGIFFAFLLPSTLLIKITFKDILVSVRQPGWHYVSYAAFVDGFKGGLEGFIASILTFSILTKEVNIGIYNAIFAIAGTLVALYLGKKLQRGKRLLIGMIGAMLILIERLVYIIFFSFFGLIVSSLIGILGDQFFTMGLISTFFDMIDHSPQHEKEYFAYITYKEIPFGIGRITGVVAFLVILHFANNVGSVKLWYILLGILPFILYFMTKKFEKVIQESLNAA